ncbi:MAG: glycerophosphodiester phosphodiesterase [Acidobacteriota bacterium]|nr:glycerophosphodiester phosphodiesterase [Acidobacteriota bacterium]
MKNLLILLVLLSFTLNAFPQTAPPVEIEGHRGARGWLPENTIPSFIKALEFGVDTLELDVVISLDNKIVVSHEPWFSSVISLDKNGKPISAEREKEHNIYKMSYAEIKLYDVGSPGNKNFPEQRKMKVHKPLLKDVFAETRKYVRQNKLKPVKYNIEIKSNPAGDDIFHPTPAVFARMVYDEVLANKMQKNVIIQSFDARPLRELRKMNVKLPLALLVSNKDGIEKNLKNLGFQPDAYSPHFSLVDAATVRYCHERNIKIVPWTVNEIADLENMKKFDLDGIITDYPDRAIKVFRKSNP